MLVYNYMCDFDGSVDAAVKYGEVNKQHVVIRHLQSKAEKANVEKVVVTSVSNRQDNEADEFCHGLNGNGLSFELFPLIEKELSQLPNIGHKIKFVPILMGDIQNNRPIGTAIKDKDLRWRWDEYKPTTTLSQLFYLAEMNPVKQVRSLFIDDRDDIIAKQYKLFSENLYLIPHNVSLRFYLCNHAMTYLRKYGESLKGKGPILWEKDWRSLVLSIIPNDEPSESIYLTDFNEKEQKLIQINRYLQELVTQFGTRPNSPSFYACRALATAKIASSDKALFSPMRGPMVLTQFLWELNPAAATENGFHHQRLSEFLKQFSLSDIVIKNLQQANVYFAFLENLLSNALQASDNFNLSQEDLAFLIDQLLVIYNIPTIPQNLKLLHVKYLFVLTTPEMTNILPNITSRGVEGNSSFMIQLYVRYHKELPLFFKCLGKNESFDNLVLDLFAKISTLNLDDKSVKQDNGRYFIKKINAVCSLLNSKEDSENEFHCFKGDCYAYMDLCDLKDRLDAIQQVINGSPSRSSIIRKYKKIISDAFKLAEGQTFASVVYGENLSKINLDNVALIDELNILLCNSIAEEQTKNESGNNVYIDALIRITHACDNLFNTIGEAQFADKLKYVNHERLAVAEIKAYRDKLVRLLYDWPNFQILQGSRIVTRADCYQQIRAAYAKYPRPQGQTQQTVIEKFDQATLDQLEKVKRDTPVVHKAFPPAYVAHYEAYLAYPIISAMQWLTTAERLCQLCSLIEDVLKNTTQRIQQQTHFANSASHFNFDRYSKELMQEVVASHYDGVITSRAEENLRAVYELFSIIKDSEIEVDIHHSFKAPRMHVINYLHAQCEQLSQALTADETMDDRNKKINHYKLKMKSMIARLRELDVYVLTVVTIQQQYQQNKMPDIPSIRFKQLAEMTQAITNAYQHFFYECSLSICTISSLELLKATMDEIQSAIKLSHNASFFGASIEKLWDSELHTELAKLSEKSPLI